MTEMAVKMWDNDNSSKGTVVYITAGEWYNGDSRDDGDGGTWMMEAAVVSLQRQWR